MRGNGFIYLKGAWAADGAKVIIVNIYSPCDIVLKRNLWKQIRQLRTANIGELWSILGDFNNVRRPSERVGISQRMQDESIVKEFNDWIAIHFLKPWRDFDGYRCIWHLKAWMRP